MKNTLSDILRDADPLRDEAPRDAATRARMRDAVVSAPRHIGRRTWTTARRVLVASALILAVGAAVKLGSRNASNAVKAVHFEARLAAAQEAIVDNRDIRSARVVQGGTPTTFGVELTFTNDGAEKIYRATAGHIGEHLEILVDDEVVLSPVIRAATSRVAMLTGNYTWDEANRIVAGLLKGTLEVRSKN